MGCDIHMAVEVREDGKWKFLDVPTYHGRNYALFECLAGVRARNGWTPIAEPRDFPADADPDTLEACNGDHTPTWLSVTEVYDYFHPYGCGVTPDEAVRTRADVGRAFMSWLDDLTIWYDRKMDKGGSDFLTYQEVRANIRLVFNFDS